MRRPAPLWLVIVMFLVLLSAQCFVNSAILKAITSIHASMRNLADASIQNSEASKINSATIVKLSEVVKTLAGP